MLFLAGAVWLGSLLSPRLFRFALKLPTGYVAGAVALVWCLVCAYLAALAGLAPIVGAFAAGLVLHEEHAAEHVARGESTLEHGLAPLAAFLVPIFFVRMGMLVDLHRVRVVVGARLRGAPDAGGGRGQAGLRPVRAEGHVARSSSASA